MNFNNFYISNNPVLNRRRFIAEPDIEVNTKKMMFFYLNTGNGHLAPAKALVKQLTGDKYKPEQLVLVNGLEESKKGIRTLIEDGYKKSVNGPKIIFEALYLLNKIKLIALFTTYLVNIFTRKYVEKAILNNGDSTIVILHFFLIKPVTEALKKHRLNNRVVVIVTDPHTAHPIWFLKKDVEFIVFSDELKSTMVLKQDIPAAKINVFPFVLDNMYSAPATNMEKQMFKNELGFRPGKKVVLVIGGGEGVPNGLEIVRQMKKIKSDVDIAFVCGRNTSLYEQVIKFRNKHKLFNMKVYGYIDFVYKLLAVSDIVLSKCGASTFREILMMKKVAIVYDYIWEQELGNMKFIRDNGMGLYQNNISKLSSLIDNILSDEEVMKGFIENIEKAKLENGCSKVAAFLDNF